MRQALYVLGQLSDDNIEWLITHGKRENVAAGQVLIHKGTINEYVYIILNGALGIFVDDGGREVQFAQRVVGDILGEMSFIDDSPPTVNVKAVEDSVLFTITKTRLAQHLEADRDFAARFYRGIAISLSYRLRESMDQTAVGHEDMAEGEIDEEEELDPTVLDSIYLAGMRFDRIVRRMMERAQ